MRIFNFLTSFKTRVSFLKLNNIVFCNTVKCKNLEKFRTISTTVERKTYTRQDESSGSEPEDEVSIYAKDLLFKNPTDTLLKRINNCVSIQELLNIFKNSRKHIKNEHIMQIIFVLHDLKKIYEEISLSKGEDPQLASEIFYTQLSQNTEFREILKLIERNINELSLNNASYLLLYLNKLGLIIEDPLSQLLINKVEKGLLKEFSIGSAAKFLEAVFSENSLRSFFSSQRLVPKVFEEIDKCNYLIDFEDLTISLNKLHRLVLNETLEKYKKSLEFFLDNNYISSKNYKTILKIILFLNYPKWREKNTILISRCMLLIKDSINKLDTRELLTLYDIFFKIQQPGEILNELQRCAGNHIQKIDNVTNQKIKLLSLLMYFSSPSHRTQFQETLKEYIKDANGLGNLILLRKLMSYVKINDKKLCELYWNKICDEMKNNEDSILKLIDNYMNFNIDVDNYRHDRFEKETLNNLRNLVYQSGYRLFPSKLCNILGFVLHYGTDKDIMDFLLLKLEENWMQLNYRDCLKLASTLRLLNDKGEANIKLIYSRKITKILKDIVKKEMNNDRELHKNNVLLKVYHHLNEYNDSISKELLFRAKDTPYITSKFIEIATHSFLTTNILIPEALENICNYLNKHNDLLAFNVEKILYLFYWMAYNPKNSGIFFENAINIILRDQERLSGLTLIQSSMALCFFNKLPNSLIKTIFNVEFFDKLDTELANCYSKDIYPDRVRNNLMQLNRAVCLDYPESNIPWFHQKYVEQLNKTEIDYSQKRLFPKRIKEYLIKTVNNPKAVLENVITPYGYHIDFVINLNENQEAVEPKQPFVKKLAILLLHRYAFTQLTVQLKGKHSLKKRHLEILGYQVAVINYSDWIEKFYAGERIEYLANLIWPRLR